MSNKSNTKWAHLPNAVHIDWVIASFKSNPDQWIEASDRVMWNKVREDAWWAAWEAVQDEPWSAIWKTIRNHAKWDAVRGEVRGALLCLTAYDDCGYMLDSDVGELRILAAFGDTRATLILPACIAFHAIKELENVN